MSFGQSVSSVVAAVGSQSQTKLLRHVAVEKKGDDVFLTMADGEAAYSAKDGCWTVRWNWKEHTAPAKRIGGGVGEYSRQKLSAVQEAKFHSEMEMWMKEGWLVPYDADLHGRGCCITTDGSAARTQADNADTSRPRLQRTQRANQVKSRY